MSAASTYHKSKTENKVLDQAIRTYLRKIGDDAITPDKTFTYADFHNEFLKDKGAFLWIKI